MKYILAFSILLFVIPVHAGSSSIYEFIKEFEKSHKLLKNKKTKKENKGKGGKQRSDYAMFTEMISARVGNLCHSYLNPQS